MEPVQQFKHGVATELRRGATVLGWVVPMIGYWRWEVNPAVWKHRENEIPPRGRSEDHASGVDQLLMALS